MRLPTCPSSRAALAFTAACLTSLLLSTTTAAVAADAGTTATGPTIGGERGRPTTEPTDEHYLARRWAGGDLASLTAALRAYRAEHGSLPATDPLRQLSPTYLSPAPKADPWGTPYRFELDGGSPRVVSAGPDRSVGTADDLAAPVDGPAPDMTAAGSPGARGTAASGRDVSPTDSTAMLSNEVTWTQRMLERLGTALESFRRQRGHYPAAGDLAQLQEALVPEHFPAADWSAKDGWGREWRFRSNDVGSSYSLSSSGADGQFETLVPLVPGAVTDPARDLVSVDGSMVRWASGTTSRARVRDAAGSATAAGGGARLAERRAEGEAGQAAATRERLEQYAKLLEAAKAKDGRYPEFDDAGRLAAALGTALPTTDAWGQPLAYLTLGSGSRYALASGGADGRLDRSLEDYLSGRSSTAGRDVVVLSGKFVD